MTDLLPVVAPLLTIVAILIVDYRRFQRECAARDRFRAEMRQERAAQIALRPQTGEVEPAPQLVPLADVIDFPKDAA